MTWPTWALFVATEFVLCLTPGPAVLFVVSQALRYGGRESLWANLGILSANTFYFAISAVGLGTILLASHDLFQVLRYAGAAYLIFLGLATIRGQGGMALPSNGWKEFSPAPGLRLMGRGFVLQASNPKSLVFFTALLPQFIDPRHGVAGQMLILGLSSAVVEFAVLAFYGGFAGRASTLARTPRFSRITNRVAGALLVIAGAGLALLDSE